VLVFINTTNTAFNHTLNEETTYILYRGNFFIL